MLAFFIFKITLYFLSHPVRQGLAMAARVLGLRLNGASPASQNGCISLSASAWCSGSGLEQRILILINCAVN